MSQTNTLLLRESAPQVFEDLYRLLASLWPTMRAGQPLGDDAQLGVHVAWLEHSRYTTTLRLEHRFAAPEDLVPRISMTVRAYHDARVAEVVSYQGCERLPAPYAVCGDPRYLPDERRQVNRFLRQILARVTAIAWAEHGGRFFPDT